MAHMDNLQIALTQTRETQKKKKTEKKKQNTNQ